MTRHRINALRIVPLLVCTIGLTGCLSSLHKQSAALAAATTPVVDQAATAYRSANALYDTASDFEAVRAFNRTGDPVYNPKSTGVLVSERDIQIRVKVLQAFQLYVSNIVAITSGTNSPALQAASQSVGANLAGLGNDLAPTIQATLGLPASTSSTSSSAQTVSTTTTAAGVTTGATTNSSTTITVGAAMLTPQVRNAVSTAANALGQFLVSRKIKKELPGIIIARDPDIKQLCELLESDIDALQSLDNRNYDTLIDDQRQYILTSTLSPDIRRAEIMKLPAIVRRQHNTDVQLTALRSSIVQLYMAHHALAATAQGNNSTSMKSKIADLAAAGSNLGTFYSSLSGK